MKAEIKEYYSEDMRETMLELNDRHLLWEIYNQNVNDDLYYTICNKYIEKLEKRYKNLYVYCLGRCSRHICIEDTKLNRRRYEFVKKYCEKLQQKMIDELNSIEA